MKENMTYLQGRGYVAGKRAGLLRVGETVLWNDNQTSKVSRIVGRTNKTISVALEVDGVEFVRKFLTSRIVATEPMQMDASVS